MPTRRGALVLVGAGLAWLVGRALAVPELYVVAAAGAAVVVLCTAAVALTGTRLAVRRRLSADRLARGEPVDVTVELRNDGWLATVPLELADDVPRPLSPGAAPARAVLDPVPRGGSAALRYRLDPQRRGAWQIGPATLRIRDPLGLAARTRRYWRTNALLVLPRVEPLPSAPLHAGQGGGGSRRTRRRLDHGDELATLREYVPGDDLRRVHWATSARRGRVMVRENEAALQAHATVVLDTRATAYIGDGPDEGFERAVTAAASVVSALSTSGYEVRLVLPDDHRPAPTARVSAHLERLAHVAPRRDVTVRPALEALRRAGTGGTIVAVMGSRRDLPVSDDPEVATLRYAVRAAGTRLALVGGHDADGLAALLRATRWRVARLDGDLGAAWAGLQRPTRARGART